MRNREQCEGPEKGDSGPGERTANGAQQNHFGGLDSRPSTKGRFNSRRRVTNGAQYRDGKMDQQRPVEVFKASARLLVIKIDLYL